MGLQRTPPKRAHEEIDSESRPHAENGRDGGAETSSARPSSVGVGETTLPSPAMAFQPRNPRVMRSPLSGSTNVRPDPPAAPDLASQPQPEPQPQTQVRHVEAASAQDPNISTTPRTAPPSQPYQTEEPPTHSEDLPETSLGDTTTSTFQTDTHDPTTPLPTNKRRKSRHPSVAATASVVPDPTPLPQPQPSQSQSRSQDRDEQKAEVDTTMFSDTQEMSQYEKNALYGKRYQAMMDTLELAVKASSETWTLPQFTECFPKFAAQNRDLFTNLWDEHRTKMKEALWQTSTDLIESNNFGPALRKIEDVVQEAKENGTAEGRSNGWRPDIGIKTVAAAANLPIHDAAYARLREEYLQLHKDCKDRYTAINEKQAQLASLESTVSDGVIDLDKTIKLLDGFPSGEMVKWMEGVLPSLSGSGSGAQR